MKCSNCDKEFYAEKRYEKLFYTLCRPCWFWFRVDGRFNMETRNVLVEKDLWIRWQNESAKSIADIYKEKGYDGLKEHQRELDLIQFEARTKSSTVSRFLRDSQDEDVKKRFKQDRDGLITEPNFSVNFDDRKAKKEKVKKADGPKLSREEKDAAVMASIDPNKLDKIRAKLAAIKAAKGEL